MDSKELMAVLEEWQAGKLDFMAASLKLMTVGCTASEAFALMKQYPQEKKEKV